MQLTHNETVGTIIPAKHEGHRNRVVLVALHRTAFKYNCFITMSFLDIVHNFAYHAGLTHFKFGNTPGSSSIRPKFRLADAFLLYDRE